VNPDVTPDFILRIHADEILRKAAADIRLRGINGKRIDISVEEIRNGDRYKIVYSRCLNETANSSFRRRDFLL
jgi:hypothetical protein